jgi:hypothetical protein
VGSECRLDLFSAAIFFCFSILWGVSNKKGNIATYSGRMPAQHVSCKQVQRAGSRAFCYSRLSCDTAEGSGGFTGPDSAVLLSALFRFSLFLVVEYAFFRCRPHFRANSSLLAVAQVVMVSTRNSFWLDKSRMMSVSAISSPSNMYITPQIGSL